MKENKMFIITVSGLFSRQEYYFRELFRFSIFVILPYLFNSESNKTTFSRIIFDFYFFTLSYLFSKKMQFCE